MLQNGRCQTLGGKWDCVLTPSPSCNKESTPERIQPPESREHEAHLMTDCPVWYHTFLQLLHTEVWIRGGRRRLEGQRLEPLGYVSEWEWQSLKCCALFVIRGLGCVTMLSSAIHPKNTPSTVPTTPLVQDTKCNRKRKLNHNHILGIYSTSIEA